jgi:hypothetical protein
MCGKPTRIESVKHDTGPALRRPRVESKVEAEAHCKALH